MGLDQPVAQTLAQSPDVVFVVPPGHPGFWHPLGIDEEIAHDRRRILIERADRDRRRILIERADSDDVFVNPYTFVPFPPEADCVRAAPRGHMYREPGSLSGRIDIEWEAVTPILVREPVPDSAQQYQFPRRRGRLAIPGSSLKGAIRSLHETLTGSCLRVLDLDYVPVYRDQVKPRGQGDGWSLARVEEVDSDGGIVGVTLCDRLAWVRASDLHRVHRSDELRTGSTVDIDENCIVNSGVRDEVKPGIGAVSEGNGWVVLITDAGARAKARPYSCAAGRLGSEIAKVGVEAWQDYLRAVEGSRDRQEGHDHEQFVDVTHGNLVIGKRRPASRRFHTGDVVWVRARDGNVQEIALSAIWRTKGQGPLSGRVPEALHPCRDPGNLCPSCRVFGAADTEGNTQAEGARQRSYRGHVRFTDAVAAAEAPTEPVVLAPMGAPRLGAGQLTLRNEAVAVAARNQRATREWGASPDNPPPGVLRQVRGRKYYWQGDPTVQAVPRHLARPHHSERMRASAELAPPGTRFWTTVWFENLSAVEVGGLLSALAPAQLLVRHATEGYRDTRIRGRLGGGRPFGLGAVDVVQLELSLESPESRYRGAEAPAFPVVDLINKFADKTPEGIRATWPHLAAVLDVGHVNPDRIWYPPGKKWSVQEHDSKGFDDPFEFFKQKSGMWTADQDRTLPVLPPPADPDQYLTIVERP